MNYLNATLWKRLVRPASCLVYLSFIFSITNLTTLFPHLLIAYVLTQFTVYFLYYTKLCRA